MVPYHIISTGSQGNAVIVNHFLLVDCGVPYKDIEPFIQDLKLVLLTHKHSDHFRPTTLRRIAEERPSVRFGCGRWLARELIGIGVSAGNIDIMDYGNMYGYGPCNVTPVPLVHDVPNCGWKIHFPVGKVFYATDTNNLNGITAKDYDLYLVEANYEDEEIKARIAEKEANGEYPYEKRVLKTHLSKAKCDDFIYRNIGPRGVYVYMHGHVDKQAET